MDEALAYARHRGIAIDHYAISPLRDFPPHQPIAEIDYRQQDLREKLTLGTDVARKLYSLKRLAKDEIELDESYTDRYRWIKRRRVESPLLRCEDYNFKSRERQPIPLILGKLPLEVVDESDDTQHGRPEIASEDIQLPSTTIKKLEMLAEKLQTPLPKRQQASAYITPPLSPLNLHEEGLSPYTPTESEAHLDLLPLESPDLDYNLDSEEASEESLSYEALFNFDDIILPDTKPRIAGLKISSPILPLTSLSDPVQHLYQHEEIDFPKFESFDEEADLDAGDAEMQLLLAKSASEIKHQLENEKLIEADHKARVDVPSLPKWQPVAPWIDASGKDVVQYLTDIDKMMWPGVKAIELKLVWNPFPRKLRHLKEEVIEADYTQNWSDGDVQSGQLVWKPDFNTDEDWEGELEPADWGVDEEGEGQLVDQFSELNSLVNDLARSKPSGALQTSLDQFMHLHGGLPPPHLLSSDHSSQGASSDLQDSEPEETFLDPMEGSKAPEVSPPFIISTSLMNKGQFLRALEDCYPGVQLIERDSDADLILSPTTGVLWSTLQRANQKALPGSEKEVGFRGRLLELAPKYEHLFILLMLPHTSAQSAAAFHDTALEDFEQFASSASAASRCEVIVIPIETDGDATSDHRLARWMASLMIKYGSKIALDDSSNNFEYETEEEQILRELGLNSFASLVIVDILQRKLGVIDAQTLQAFFDLPLKEKRRIFGPLLGEKWLQNFKK